MTAIADTSPAGRLLQAIAAIPALEVYRLAPRAYVERGFRYCINEAIQGFEWSADSTLLTVRIKGTRHYHTGFTLEQDGRLLFACDCPAWTPQTNCKHIVCAVVTIKNLLEPKLFRHAAERSPRREKLLAALGGTIAAEPETKPEFIIVLTPNSNSFFVSVELSGQEIPFYSPLLPPTLQRLLAGNRFIGQQQLLYLAENSAYKTVIRIDKGDHPIRFRGDISFRGATILDAGKTKLRVSRILVPSEEAGAEAAVVVGGMAFMQETGELAQVVETKGWNLWHSFQDEAYRTIGLGRMPKGDDIDLPIGVLAEKQLSIPPVDPATAPPIVLRIDGKQVFPAPASSTERMVILPSGNPSGDFLLRADIIWGDFAEAPSVRAFSLFSELASLPTPLRTKKRQRTLVELFFSILAAPTAKEAKRLQKEALGYEFGVTKVRREAARFLTHHLDLFRQGENRLLFHGGSWRYGTVNLRQQLLLFSIPFEIFGPEIFFNAPPGNMLIPADMLSSLLPVLSESLTQSGIPLYLNGKPVVTSAWDIVVNTSAAGIDWFELSTEIRCAGSNVDNADFQEGLSGSYVEREHSIEIIPSAITEAMARLRAFSSGKARKKEKETVIIPRLRILDLLALKNSGVTVRLPPEEEAVISRLAGLTDIDDKPLPEGLTASVRPYQHQGYRWLAFLYEHRFGACLADDMGLGKTLQAIAFLAGLKEECIAPRPEGRSLPHLVVVPTSLVFNWEREIDRFYPGLRVHVYAGAERKETFSDCDLVITTYGTLRRDADLFARQRFHVLILDEAQAVKNIRSATCTAVRRLRPHFTLVMTGTPVENHLGEFHSIIDLAVPGLLEDEKTFRKIAKEGGLPLTQSLGRTRPFLLRRTKQAVLHDLPPKIENEIMLDLDDQQSRLYRRTVEQVRAEINGAYRDRTENRARIIALAAITRLRQICLAPQLVTGKVTGSSPKLDYLVETLEELLDEGHSVLVFSQFTSFLDLCGPQLREASIPFLRLDGSTPPATRKKLVSGFQENPKPQVFLLSLKAGGQGLNLTKASYVFHLDPWWNPAVEAQASDRAHRIGQQQTVTVTRLIMAHSIEEKMAELKRRKLELYRLVMEKGEKEEGATLTREDFEFLLEG